ncbi:unnamed protein product, partial [Polarella glacialis]
MLEPLQFQPDDQGTLGSLPYQAIVLQPGFVLLKAALDEATQQRLAKLVMETGRDGPHGFRDVARDGTLQLNNGRTRGRVYCALSKHRRWVTDLCLQQVGRARLADRQMPGMDPTHVVLLRYTSEAGRAWHRDNGGNDCHGEEPVVSVSLGDSCDFAFREEWGSEGKVVRLDSGDVVLFGGPSRLVLHAVTQIHAGTAPPSLAGILPGGRLNVTYRATPHSLGHEDEFRLIGAYAKQLFGRNPAE